MIEIKNVKFKYSDSLQLVLDIPSFSIFRGEKVFLYGPSGCGKTTLLETLAGVIIPDSGLVNISNEDITKLSPSARDRFRANHIGYIFQSFNLIPYLSVLENITLPLYLSPLKRSKVPKESEIVIAKEICSQLGISELVEKKVTKLSVGQQQRVAAARAILGQPDIILADEPTSSLDFDHREKFIKLLFEICQKYKISVLFVSHDRTLKSLFDRSLSLPEINLAGPK